VEQSSVLLSTRADSVGDINHSFTAAGLYIIQCITRSRCTVGVMQGVWLATCFSMGPVGKGSSLLGSLAGLVCQIPLRARNFA